VGAILAELLNHGPFFRGQNDIDQLFRVIQIMGTPGSSGATWPEACTLPDFDKISFPEATRVPFKKLLPGASAGAISVLERFLVYAPYRRLQAADALADCYFSQPPLPTPHRRLDHGGNENGGGGGERMESEGEIRRKLLEEGLRLMEAPIG
jgi:hypothetical protein